MIVLDNLDFALAACHTRPGAADDMNSGVDGRSYTRPRGRNLGLNRRVKRDAKKAPNGGGAGDAASQYRNKTWKREDAALSQDEEEKTSPQNSVSFGNSTNGVDGLVRGKYDTDQLLHGNRFLEVSTNF